MSDYSYEGAELPRFAEAVHWKRYFTRHLRPWLTGDVLEVGAGIGGTTRLLYDGRELNWTCLEPDAALARQIQEDEFWLTRPFSPEVIVGSLESVAFERSFDAIIYVDVLEHVEDDRAELQRAARLLKPGGVLVVLSPAHPTLFSEFDRAVGHFRRYSRAALTALSPPGLQLERLFYLDAIGTLLLLANRLLIRSPHPTRRQVLFWDRVVISLSQCLDPVLRYRAGRSIIAVWRTPHR
ncbi:methyltransferase domain-containing protein [bacterium]|nr:methyltransferase domain-containing protein [bacterium]